MTMTPLRKIHTPVQALHVIEVSVGVEAERGARREGRGRGEEALRSVEVEVRLVSSVGRRVTGRMPVRTRRAEAAAVEEVEVEERQPPQVEGRAASNAEKRDIGPTLVPMKKEAGVEGGVNRLLEGEGEVRLRREGEEVEAVAVGHLMVSSYPDLLLWLTLGCYKCGESGHWASQCPNS